MYNKIDPCDTMRVNLIAAAVGLQQCTKTESNIVPIPGGDSVIAIGTPAHVVQSLAEDPLDLPLPCDVTIGGGTIRKGVTLRALVMRAQGLHRALMHYMPKPTPEQLTAFQHLLAQGSAGSDLTTVDCPACKDGEACDECSGQGQIIVSRTDLAALLADHVDSEGGHHD